MAAKQRAKWWIVSTHVLTTGFVMPFLAGLAATFVVMRSGLDLLPALGLHLAILAVGYIGGAYYSLNYLRQSALSDEWRQCITPSIATFVVLCILGFLLNARNALGSMVVIGSLIAFYVVIVVAFAKITADGFNMLQRESRNAA